MAGKEKISAAQLYSVFFVSMISAVFTSVSSGTQNNVHATKIWSLFSFMVWAALAAVPVFLLAGKNGDQTLLSRCSSFSPGLAKAAAAVYAAAALWYTALGLARLGLFMQTELFPGKNVRFLLLLFTAAAAYTASRGLETLGRTSVIFLIFLILGIAVITGASMKYFDAAELPTLFPIDAKSLLTGSFSTFAQSAELLSLFFLTPQLTGKRKTQYAFWLFAFLLTVCFIYTIIAGVTGLFGERQTFEFYALTSVASLGVLERLDELLSGLWILCAFLKTSFLLLLSANCLCKTSRFPVKKIVCISFVAVYSVYLLVSRSESAYKTAANPFPNGILAAVLLFVIPVTVFCIARRKRTL